MRLLCCLALALALAWHGGLSAQDAPARVRLIAINDFHGHLEPGDNALAVPDPADATATLMLRAGGAAHLATLIAQLRAQQPAHLVLSAGDLVGASPLISALFHDEPTVEVMNLIGLDVNAAGNHEFDHGVAELQRLIGGGCAPQPRADLLTCAHPDGRYAGARFPFLAANVVDAEGKPLLAGSLIRIVDGVRIGVVGAVTRSTPGIVSPNGIRGWRFQREAEAINRQVRELTAAGVHTIVALIHEGGQADGGFDACDNPRGEIFDIAARLDPAVDVVLSAHTHRGYNCVIDGRSVIQGASFGRLVSVVDLAIDRASGKAIRSAARARNVPVVNALNTSAALRAAYPPLPPDPAVAALVAHYRELAAPLAQRPAGRISARIERRPDEGGDSPAGRLIADAHLAATAGVQQGAAQIALTNPGGIRTDLTPAADGKVSYADAFAMQPFGNVLVTLTLSGAQLKALLEAQWSRTQPDRVRFLQPSRGFTYAWRQSGAHGARIDAASMQLDGRPIDATDRLRVTVNSFLADGGDGFGVLREATERSGGPLDIDALVTYLRQHSVREPLAPEAAARIRRLP